MILRQLKKKNRKSKDEILRNAYDSFEFDYQLNTQETKHAEEESFSEAVKCIPKIEANIQEVDYFA